MMKKFTITYKIFAGLCALALLGYGCSKKITPTNATVNVPSLQEISGRWVSADTVAMEPSIRNFRGQALLNRDATSVSWFVSAPYSGGYHTGVMKINGKVPMATMFRWLPYEGLRKCETDNWEVLSSTRMLPDKDGIMWQIEITNNAAETRDLNIDLDMIGFISKYGGDWQWWYPYPKMKGSTTERDEEVETIRRNIGKSSAGNTVLIEKLVEGKPTGEKVPVKLVSDKEILNATKYKSVIQNDDVYIYDTETQAITAFATETKPGKLTKYNSGATASWSFKVKPGEKKVIRYFMAYGDNPQLVFKNLGAWKGQFEKEFKQVQQVWEERWTEIFRPKNTFLSGCVPVLETQDTLAKRVYYTGPLTMLYLTNLGLPQHQKVFLTGGPRWGASITFYWDITEWSTFFAVTDPAMMKEHISSWIKIDPSKYYGVDNFGGKGVGNPYSANYWALFQLMRSYITISRDTAFLNQVINGKTVLQTLEHYATNWQNISVYGKPGCTDPIYKLADFGDDEWNLLECVPTYKHIVPSFNAGYIWMMRETAKLYALKGDDTKAAELNKKADDLIPLLMQLYKGDGVWDCLYPNGKKVEVRHILDFMFMGRYLPKDLPEKMKKEMMEFLYRELMTKNWMRAQSLQDVAAKNSDRPDHGPLGAFDGWPAGTMDALTQMGHTDKAFDFYRAIEPVTHEGIWAQAHELWGDNKNNANARVRIAERGWHNRESAGGIGMSQVMLKCFFGFYPDMQGPAIQNYPVPAFEGTLYHVLWGGKYYTITLKDGKRTLIEE